MLFIDTMAFRYSQLCNKHVEHIMDFRKKVFTTINLMSEI